ncbi:MAG TPA: excinuclease ABC subunit UvrB [Bacilli bacterium]|jgi:excinuclease ABC subunit B|nr:excinuclease ABC subunit UvrB [Bacilli bacterium]HPY78953.1 excinuclease ABC subunit UvrB [Bacilli bacterium]HQB96899.1 excinuclease ABC subunit UvrB [Bacilli bacterium]
MKKTKHKFVLETTFTPTGDQPTAIKELVAGLERGDKHQVLLGATGTGKTFTIANVIEKVQKPTLILVHNKTLAGQLYAEFKALFPNNRVEYFVSNFDFYQPEAYVPSRDMYIEKEAVQNAEIEMLRSAAINSLLERNDTIIVASVAAIYGLSDPEEYSKLSFNIVEGEVINRKEFLIKLVDAQYTRNDYELRAGTFRVRGDVIEIMLPISEDYLIQVDTFDDTIEKIREIDVLTGEVRKTFNTYPIFPAYAYASSRERINAIVPKILSDLASRLSYFADEGKLLEAERLEFRTRQDVDSLQEFGICPGIENYARYIDGRKAGEKPYTLMDYFPKDYLLVIDESHVTLPQVRGMFNGDRSRKQNLVDYGFRLPSALDNRPLQFNEFEGMINQVIYTSATPGDYELDKTGGVIVEQLIRPTGLVDPEVFIKPSVGQIDDLMYELTKVIERGERAMVVTLTIKMAEDLTHYLKEHDFKVVYLHNETKTLERSQIIYELRKGKYDVLVGINLLREGLDIPEVSLVAIIDADKEGFLRSERSLIQVMGRASRNVNGKVIMYANNMTGSMERAIAETKRRRDLQIAYNKKHGIVPTTIIKPLGEPLHNFGTERELERINKGLMSRKQLEKYIREIRAKMNAAAKAYDFEKAIEYREILFELEGKSKKT